MRELRDTRPKAYEDVETEILQRPRFSDKNAETQAQKKVTQ
jgi:hypothetical protein